MIATVSLRHCLTGGEQWSDEGDRHLRGAGGVHGPSGQDQRATGQHRPDVRADQEYHRAAQELPRRGHR